ncbi:MAG: OmpA family protein [Alphaproteobacteria bacterium]
MRELQALVIISLLILTSTHASARNFPSGSENVEINLDALKPMDTPYTPPPMFDAPLTAIEQNKERSRDTAPKNNDDEQEGYFNPPPIPPQRPSTFSVSQQYIQSLKNTGANTKLQKPMGATRPVDNNDIGAEVVDMNARNVLDNIEANRGLDITEEITPPSVTSGSTEKNIRLPNEEAISLTFEIGSAELREPQMKMLESAIVKPFLRNTDLKLEIRSYASTNIEEKNARRTSLSRALKIRNHLEDQGIDRDRVTIRALGDQTDKLPTDRADLLISY